MLTVLGSWVALMCRIDTQSSIERPSVRLILFAVMGDNLLCVIEEEEEEEEEQEEEDEEERNAGCKLNGQEGGFKF